MYGKLKSPKITAFTAVEFIITVNTTGKGGLLLVVIRNLKPVQVRFNAIFLINHKIVFSILKNKTCIL